MLNSFLLNKSQLFEYLKVIISSSDHIADYFSNKNKIEVFDKSGSKSATIHLPWVLPPFEGKNELLKFISHWDKAEFNSIIILIQAGRSALAHCSSGGILEHKLIRKYMVRKKQGKAQITYLNQKGKSRAGSRIRLNQTVQFFEDINDQVNLWMKEQNPRRILISCPPRLWGLLFQSKVKPVFSKKDARVFKIPLAINIPDRQELMRVHKLSQKIIFETDRLNPDMLDKISNGY